MIKILATLLGLLAELGPRIVDWARQRSAQSRKAARDKEIDDAFRTPPSPPGPPSAT